MAVIPSATEGQLGIGFEARQAQFERAREAFSPSTDKVASADSMPFGNALRDAISAANTDSLAAGRMKEQFAQGLNDDIHGTMIAAQKASIEVKLVSTVRNKIVDAFYDLWRMNM